MRWVPRETKRANRFNRRSDGKNNLVIGRPAIPGEAWKAEGRPRFLWPSDEGARRASDETVRTGMGHGGRSHRRLRRETVRTALNRPRQKRGPGRDSPVRAILRCCGNSPACRYAGHRGKSDRGAAPACRQPVSWTAEGICAALHPERRAAAVGIRPDPVRPTLMGAHDRGGLNGQQNHSFVFIAPVTRPGVSGAKPMPQHKR